MRILDIGCGKRKTPGAIGVDKRMTPATDVVCDLDERFYPFRDNTFERVHITDVLEHVEDIVSCLEEVHRISRDGAEVLIRVPHFSSTQAFGDITHRHFFSSQSFDYFTGECEALDFYTGARFEKLSLKINFWKLWRLTGFSVFANLFPVFYEKYLPFIFTAMNIEVRLRVVKR